MCVSLKKFGGWQVPAADTDFSSVPAQLAVPWHRVCTTLGLPCILVAAGVDMWNYVKLDQDGYAPQCHTPHMVYCF